MRKSVRFFDDIVDVHNLDALTLKDKYPKYRSIFEQACRELTKDAPVSFSNLHSRQSYLGKKYQLDRNCNYWLNGLRIAANNVLHGNQTPAPEDYPVHLKALCEAL